MSDRYFNEALDKYARDKGAKHPLDQKRLNLIWLRVRDQAYAAGEKISDTEVQRRVITLAKLTPERAWLAGVASVALVQACQDARRAYTCRAPMAGPRRPYGRT